MVWTLPRDIAFLGVSRPNLSLLLFIAAGLGWALVRFLSGFDLYRFFWHPAMLRLSLFTCLFGAMALTVYR